MIRTLAGLRSRWTTPARCSAPTPSVRAPIRSGRSKGFAPDGTVPAPVETPSAQQVADVPAVHQVRVDDVVVPVAGRHTDVRRRPAGAHRGGVARRVRVVGGGDPVALLHP